MGEEASKLTRPKPAEACQTSRDRRSRRRHSYVGFRTYLNNQDRDEHQHNEDCEQSELEDGQGNSLCSSQLIQVSPGLLDQPLLENIGTGEPIYQSVSSQTFGVNRSSFPPFSHVLESKETSRNFVNPYESSEDLAEYMSGRHNGLNGQNQIAFVNIDSYEPDSNDGEEDDAQHKFSLAREEPGAFQQTVDNTLSELEKHIESSTGLQSKFCAFNHSVSREHCEEVGLVPLTTPFSIDSESACPNNGAFEYSAEGEAILRSNLSGASYETHQIKSTVDFEIRTPLATANEQNVHDGRTDQGNSPEPVVKPKIRKQNTANQLKRENLLPDDDEEESGSWRRSEIAEDQQGHTQCALQIRREEMSSSMFFDLSECEGHQNHTELDLRRNAATNEQNIPNDITSGHAFQDCSRYFYKHEDSSEWSDGEWSTPLPTYFTAILLTQEQISSDESWETVPSREEHEPETQSSSEESTKVCFQGGEHSLLEEEEIPWLLSPEEDSSSDEENDPPDNFLSPGFLSAINNLEYDSSESEDLNIEWSLLDELDGIELVQLISCMDPEFLELILLQEHMQHSMEAALVQLESLLFEQDEPTPPATAEIIDSLPWIVITDEHGQAYYCIICCCEYEKNEIMTELPCHHLFHRDCVTIWLEQSGTCPLCRHVLEPVHLEAADVSGPHPSDDDSDAPGNNAAGASN